MPPSFITFDDPHLPAGTPLLGQYPSGWWTGAAVSGRSARPFGKFGTFTLSTVGSKNNSGGNLSFYAPRIFAGVDVYNDGDVNATMTIRSPKIREVAYTIKPKELLRIKTGWHDPSSKVIFNFKNGQALRFDNLAYSHP